MPTRTYQTLISADELLESLQAHQPVKIFDCSAHLTNSEQGYQDYLAIHIPNAHYLHLEKDLSGQKTGKNGRHPLPQREILAQRLAQLGLNQHEQVIVYDRQNAMFAARAWWLLRWLGHAQVAVLDGGLQAWKQKHYPTETSAPSSCAPGNFKIQASLEKTVDKATIYAQLEQKKYLIIDARSPDRFLGENETIDRVGGHIPNARNRYFAYNLKKNGLFKSASELQSELNTIVAPHQKQEIILQCGSGISACHNALAFKIAGFNETMLYPGSWSEWSEDPNMPVETNDKSSKD